MSTPFIMPNQQDGIINPYSNQFGLLQSSNERAVMYIFSPRPFDVQYRRSLTYRFTDEFTNKASEALFGHGEVNDNKAIASLLRDPNSFGTVLPDGSPQTTTTHLQNMSDKYTFLLVINGERPRAQMIPSGFNQSEVHSQLANRLNNNRSIYYGFFLEEPINPRTMHGTEPTINGDCRLMITHKTVIAQMSTWGANGATLPNYNVIGNTDIVNPGFLSTISSGPLYQVTPDKLLENSEMVIDPGNGELSTWDMFGEANSLMNAGGEVAIRSDYSDPRENIKEILRGISRAHTSVIAQGNMGSMSTPDIPGFMTYGSMDTFSHMLKDYLDSGDRSAAIGLQENEIVSMATIDAMYKPTIQPFSIERSIYWDTADQSTSSPSVIWSSLVMQSAPVLMTNAGLSEISLEYDSYYDMMRSFTASHLAYVAEVEKQKSVKVFLHELKERLFTLLKLNRGDFRIQLSLQSSGISNCTLNFYCDDERTTSPFEIPSIAGGLNSNMVASIDVAANNGSNLAALTRALSGVDEDALPQSLQADYDANVRMVDRQHQHQPYQGNVPNPFEPVAHQPNYGIGLKNPYEK